MIHLNYLYYEFEFFLTRKLPFCVVVVTVDGIVDSADVTMVEFSFVVSVIEVLVFDVSEKLGNGISEFKKIFIWEIKRI